MGLYESHDCADDFLFNTNITVMAHRIAGLVLFPAASEQLELDDCSRSGHVPDSLRTCRCGQFGAIIAVMVINVGPMPLLLIFFLIGFACRHAIGNLALTSIKAEPFDRRSVSNGAGRTAWPRHVDLARRLGD